MASPKEIFNPKLNAEEQLIVTMIALTGMIICLVVMAVYLMLFVADTTMFRILIGVNAFFGAVFLGSNLYGMRQQYKMVKSMAQIQNELKIEDMLPPIEPDSNLKGGKE